MAKKSSSKRSAKKTPSTRKPAKRSSKRSKKVSKEKEIRFNMVISEKDQRDIKAKAKRAKMSMSAWVRQTLRKAK